MPRTQGMKFYFTPISHIVMTEIEPYSSLAKDTHTEKLPLQKPFDPATVDLNDIQILENLGRQELRQLCQLHKVAP
jgi:hypothetical protein